MTDDREVVRDQQQAEREAPREVDEQVRHLGLRRRVERREGLIEHEHGRIGRQRPRDGNSLPLPAAELVWVPCCSTRKETDELEKLCNSRPPSTPRRQVERVEGVGELGADLSPRVQ